MSQTLPTGFRVQRASWDDFSAMIEMSQAAEMAESGQIRTSETMMRSFWNMPGHDISQDAWLIKSPEGRIAGLTGIGHSEPANLGADIQVHPDYVDLGLYDNLIEPLLARSRDLIPFAPPEARVTLSVWCEENNQREHQALERAGFMHVRSNWLMEINMKEPPQPAHWPEGLELRPYTPDLLQAVFEADNDAFRDHWGRTEGNFDMWQVWTVKHEEFDPSLWFLIFDGQEIAGFALCTMQHGEAWVGELGVRRPWRRKGLGLELLHHAFSVFYQRGERRVVLNVDAQSLTGATRLYTRAGMHAFRQTDIFQIELRPGIELSTQELAL